jgi:hypothetical protein
MPPSALVPDPDELGERGGVPAVDDAAPRDHRGHRGYPEPFQLGAGAGFGLDVDGVERHFPRREQLSRLGAGASARAVVEDGFRVGHLRLLPSTAS